MVFSETEMSISLLKYFICASTIILIHQSVASNSVSISKLEISKLLKDDKQLFNVLVETLMWAEYIIIPNKCLGEN